MQCGWNSGSGSRYRVPPHAHYVLLVFRTLRCTLTVAAEPAEYRRGAVPGGDIHCQCNREYHDRRCRSCVGRDWHHIRLLCLCHHQRIPERILRLLDYSFYVCIRVTYAPTTQGLYIRYQQHSHCGNCCFHHHRFLHMDPMTEHRKYSLYVNILRRRSHHAVGASTEPSTSGSLGLAVLPSPCTSVSSSARTCGL